MKQEELQRLLDLVKYVPSDKRDEATNAVLLAASESMSFEKMKSLTSEKHTDSNQKQTTENESSGNSEILIFSDEEIKKMPKTFRKEFRVQGCTAHIHKRRSGKHHWNYEVRYRRNGYNINVSSNNLEEAKQKFINRLHEVEKYGTDLNNSIPSTFDGFASYYFENFYKRKVAAETYRIGTNQFKNHLSPHFGSVPLRKITPKKCQELIDRLDEEGKGKTADDAFSLLNMIFKAAVKHCVLPNNPMDMVFHTKHERKHGSALSKEEETLLLDSTAGTPQQLMFAIGLYTGMRPNEYETARLEDDFIVAVNSKRKNGKVEYKKIPVTPMLRPYLNGISEIKFSSLRVLRERFNKLFPNRRMYDLRTTFYTRCQECGVAPVARDTFVGHSLGALGNTYTDLSDEYLKREGEKLNY